MLTVEQIQYLMEQLNWVTVYDDQGMRLQRMQRGWADPDSHDGKMRGTCQAALSIMLEVAARAQR